MGYNIIMRIRVAYLKFDDAAVNKAGFVFGLILFLPAVLDFALTTRLLTSFLYTSSIEPGWLLLALKLRRN